MVRPPSPGPALCYLTSTRPVLKTGVAQDATFAANQAGCVCSHWDHCVSVTTRRELAGKGSSSQGALAHTSPSQWVRLLPAGYPRTAQGGPVVPHVPSPLCIQLFRPQGGPFSSSGGPFMPRGGASIGCDPSIRNAFLFLW